MKTTVYILLSLVIFFMTLMSCEEILNVTPVKERIGREMVFNTDATATSAVLGIYSKMYGDFSGFAGGGINSVMALTALSSHDFRYNSENIDVYSFEAHLLKSNNPLVVNLWNSTYSSIYETNSAIEGLSKANEMNDSLRLLLKGEALFVRAFCYFYLVNLFGEIPIAISTDYVENSLLPRLPVSQVYQQIIKDLTEAYVLLDDLYVTAGRVRPNKGAAAAMLARVYLFVGDWANAEYYSTEVLNDSRYVLADLQNVFLSNSQEAIWQLMPEGLYQNTNEGHMLVLESPPYYESQPFTLDDELLHGFEIGDSRRVVWVDSLPVDDSNFYYSAKYKVANGGASTTPRVPLSEYSMVLRLAEQYFVRANARVKLGNLSGAVEDLNRVRQRANLSDIVFDETVHSSAAIDSLVENERRFELFGEWGHRWLDLKRSSGIESALISRPNWTRDAALYPVPQTEFVRNPNLGLQNPGY